RLKPLADLRLRKRRHCQKPSVRLSDDPATTVAPILFPERLAYLPMMKRLHVGARARRSLLVAGIVVIVLVLFGFFGLPPIVRSQAEKRLSAELNRPVSIEK